MANPRTSLTAATIMLPLRFGPPRDSEGWRTNRVMPVVPQFIQLAAEKRILSTKYAEKELEEARNILEYRNAVLARNARSFLKHQ